MILLTLSMYFNTFVKISIFFDINLLLLFLEVILFYYLIKTQLSVNSFQLLGYLSVVILSFSSYLFYLQLDVFGCFMLVSESIVILFGVSIVIHLNWHNLPAYRKNPIN